MAHALTLRMHTAPAAPLHWLRIRDISLALTVNIALWALILRIPSIFA
ncbi:MAG: hypothetical protein ABW360_12040 [Phenylobacterium sp.]